MSRPSGRRTRHVTVYMSPAEVLVWDAVRASETTALHPAPSRADMLLDWLLPRCEHLAASSQDPAIRLRSQKALDAWDQVGPPDDASVRPGRLARP